MFIGALINFDEPLFISTNVYGIGIRAYINKIITGSNSAPIELLMPDVIYNGQNIKHCGITYFFSLLPLILFMTPINDNCEDLDLFKNGIKLYSMLQKITHDIIKELDIKNIGIPMPENYYKIMFSELDLEKFQRLYGEAGSVLKTCQTVGLTSDDRGGKGSPKGIQNAICDYDFIHMNLDAKHLSSILGKFELNERIYGSDDFRYELFNLIGSYMVIDDKNAFVIIQLFTRIKLVYYEIYKMCYSEMINNIKLFD
jgi:hypothetical protein